LPCIMLRLFYNYDALQQSLARRPLNNYIGSKFNLTGFSDLNGKNVTLDFTKSKYTVIDFWHKSCPPCLGDMKEFKELIAGYNNSISIVSISVNSVKEWTSLFNNHNSAFYFLRDSVENWKHLVMKSAENPRFNNSIPMDNIQRLENTYRTNTFPLYLIVDGDGDIVAAPASAVDYLKTYVFGRSKIVTFLTSASTWSYTWIAETLFWYSGLFWMVLVVVMVFTKREGRLGMVK
jgi:thiol-disulfide isomerase/thioredoxin